MVEGLCSANLITLPPKTRGEAAPWDSVVGWLVAGVSLRLRGRGEGRLVRVGYAAGIGCVGGRRVSRGGIGWRVGGVEVWRRHRVGGDGDPAVAVPKTAHGKIGQDPLGKLWKTRFFS